jgi:hypothetical protein
LVYAGNPEIEEYQVKAAFVYNFAKFVDWPPEVFKNPNDPIRICVLGRDPFGSSLEDSVRGKVIGTRGFVVEGIQNSQQAGRCQILFFISSERKRFRSILQELSGLSILTVGESDGFAGGGEVITLKLTGGRVCLEIDTVAADRARLRISSKLLSLAQSSRK